MEAGKKKTERRRNFVVDKKWQAAVAARLIVAAMVAIMIVQFLAIHFLASEEAWYLSGTELGLVAVAISGTQLVLLFVALWRTAMRITHTVAGPAWVLERAIDALREGKFDSRLKLREGDCLKPLAAAIKRLTEALEAEQWTGVSPASAEAPEAGEPEVVEAGQSGFTLVDTMIATCLLIVGTLSCATLGMSCSNLQQRTKDYVVASVIANDTFERLRSADVQATYTQYTASPVTTVQERQVTVEFPEEAMAGIFGGTMDVTAALAAGFLPVRITVRSADQNFVFTTFLGER